MHHKAPASGHNLGWLLTGLALVCTAAFCRAQTLEEALDATNLTWTTLGNAPWFAQTNISYDGIAAAQSGPVSVNQTSILQTVVSGPGTLTFSWKLVAGGQETQLALRTNGTTASTLSSGVNTNWQMQTVYLASGNYTLQWHFLNSFGSTNNKAWIDQVSYVTGTTAPIITSQPISQHQAPGLGMSFKVIAVGTPPLGYQWQFNSNDISGATASTLSLTNVLRDSFGSYRVTVSNIADTIISSNATLVRGHIAAWGNNYGGYGQNSVPQPLTNVLGIAAGLSHNVILKSDHTVLSWGGNYYGQINTPPGLSNVIAVAAGSYTSLALKADGTVAVWGNLTPPPVDLTNIVAIEGGCGHALALKNDGTVIGWGAMTALDGLTNVVGIGAGCSHSLAVKADGRVVAWGADHYGDTIVPPDLTNAVAVAAGDYHSMALRGNGTVRVWGYNGEGETNVPPDLTNVIAIASGNYFCMALKTDGTIRMWGGVPSAPAYLTNVTAISAGQGYCLALVGDGLPVIQARLPQPIVAADGFNLSLPSESGRVYALEFKTAVDGNAWTALPLSAGNGNEMLLMDTANTNVQRFYRVRRW